MALSVVRGAGAQEMPWGGGWVQQFWATFWQDAGRLSTHIHMKTWKFCSRIYPPRYFKHTYSMKYIKFLFQCCLQWWELVAFWGNRKTWRIHTLDDYAAFKGTHLMYVCIDIRLGLKKTMLSEKSRSRMTFIKMFIV